MTKCCKPTLIYFKLYKFLNISIGVNVYEYSDEVGVISIFENSISNTIDDEIEVGTFSGERGMEKAVAYVENFTSADVLKIFNDAQD